jgi:hypothetical protein
MRLFLPVFALVLGTACGADAPTPSPAPLPGQGQNGPAVQAADGAGGPANNAEVGFGTGETPSLNEIEANRFELAPGTGVKVGGTLSYKGSKQGAILLQVVTLKSDPERALRENQQADKRYVDLLHHQTLNATGAFEVLVPRNTGKVQVIAFLDEHNDGPSSSDAAGIVAVEVGTAAVSGLQLEMSDSPDLGEFVPPARR